MDLSKIKIEYGAEYLDIFLEMPKRSQELLFAIFESSLFEDNKESLILLDDVLNCGDHSYPYCKSPIEKIFILAYEYVSANEGFLMNEILSLYPQEKIVTNGHNYFADFLFDTEHIKCAYVEHPLKLVIECDGHDFHEKTKEQVEKNNQRDYDLKISGYDVIHFSGSQIYQNPIKCAQDTVSYIKSKIGEVKIDF